MYALPMIAERVIIPRKLIRSGKTLAFTVETENCITTVEVDCVVPTAPGHMDDLRL